MKKLTKLVILLVVLAFCLPAIGQPANRNILIFTKTLKCFSAEGERELDNGGEWLWDWAGDERVTGYLILDVGYDEDGQIVQIINAEQVEYWREGRERWYDQEGEWFDVERIEIEDRWGRPIVYWVLEAWDSWDGDFDEGIWFVMLRGKARMMNIGLGWQEEEKREVASVLEGCYQSLEWWEILDGPGSEYIDKYTCCETLRLDAWRTRLANLYLEAYYEADGVGFTFEPFWWAVGGNTTENYFVGGEGEQAGPFGIVKAWLQWLGYEEIPTG